MNNSLNIATIELDIAWNNTDANLYNAERAIAALPEGTDVAVLPETFTTGFILDGETASATAQTPDGPVIEAMKRWAQTYNMAVAGSVIWRQGNELRNRALFVEPSGDVTVYDKRHLFGLSGEAGVYSPGHRHIPVQRFRGWNLALAICFDLRFPTWLRNTDLRYDALIIMANWPDSRRYAWDSLLVARAIENEAYVIGCNRTGIDDYGVYSPSSAIINPKGRPITERFEAAGIPAARATLSLDELRSFRTKFPVIDSADHFTISL